MDRHQALAGVLLERADSLSARAADRYLEGRVDLFQRFPAVHLRCVEDGRFHVAHLAAALSAGRPELFDAYVVWTAELLAGFGIDRIELERHLGVLAELIAEEVDPAEAALVGEVVAQSLRAEPEPTPLPASYLEGGYPLDALAQRFLAALVATDRHAASQMILAAADDGVPIEDLYLQVFQPCLRETGRLWALNQISVAQEHFVTAAVQLVMAQLYPRLFRGERNGRTVVVSSVGGELHELGGRMVADIFELRGWTSHFTGANTPSRDVAALAADVGADVVAVSATLSTHVAKAEEVVRAVRAVSDAKILVGGRPFLQVPGLWEVVAADATAEDAVAAVLTAGALLEAS